MNENLVNIGDIFVASWGYDQTNVDAYQVVRLTPKCAMLREIGTRPIPGTDGFMCCYVEPVKDTFKPEAKEFRVRTPNGELEMFGIRYGLARKHFPGKRYYNSWYA